MSEGRSELEKLYAEFLGAQAMNETFLCTLLAHFAAQTSDEALTIRKVMSDVEDNLRRALADAEEDDRAAAVVAHGRFMRISQGVALHLQRLEGGTKH